MPMAGSCWTGKNGGRPDAPLHKAEWGKIPEAYKGRWEPTPLNLERVKSGELPAEYIGKRNTIVNDEHRGTVLITEGAHFVIDE